MWWQTNAEVVPRRVRREELPCAAVCLCVEEVKALYHIPNDITPIAWNIPVLTVRSGVLKEPLASVGARTPWTTTVTMMTTMLIKASVLAFASCSSESVLSSSGCGNRRTEQEDVPLRCLYTTSREN